MSTAARDKRVAAVVSIAGGYDIGGTFLANLGSDGFANFIGQINGLATREYESGETEYIPAIAKDLSGRTESRSNRCRPTSHTTRSPTRPSLRRRRC
jgi:hypothetical protein